MVLAVSVAAFIGSLNTTRTVADSATPVTPAIGVMPLTVGGVVSDEVVTVTVALAAADPAELVAVAV
jgi:hypothetical protein